MKSNSFFSSIDGNSERALDFKSSVISGGMKNDQFTKLPEHSSYYFIGFELHTHKIIIITWNSPLRNKTIDLLDTYTTSFFFLS